VFPTAFARIPSFEDEVHSLAHVKATADRQRAMTQCLFAEETSAM